MKRLALALVFSLTFLFSFIACETTLNRLKPLTPEQSSAILDAGYDTVDVLDAQIAVAQAKLAELQPGSSEHSKAQSAITTAIKARNVVARATTDFESTLDEEGNLTPEGSVTVIGNLLPPPFNIIFGLAAGVGVGVWRSRKVREAATNIVRSIEIAMKASPQLDAAMHDPQAAKVLKESQSPLAKKIVDEAQGKKTAPIT